jgi:hypothetical protein
MINFGDQKQMDYSERSLTPDEIDEILNKLEVEINKMEKPSRQDDMAI